MQITINGKPQDFDAANSLEAVICQLCADNRYVLAELNGQIVRRPEWAGTELKSGDKLELVTLVGGG